MLDFQSSARSKLQPNATFSNSSSLLAAYALLPQLQALQQLAADAGFRNTTARNHSVVPRHNDVAPVSRLAGGPRPSGMKAIAKRSGARATGPVAPSHAPAEDVPNISGHRYGIGRGGNGGQLAGEAAAAVLESFWDSDAGFRALSDCAAHHQQQQDRCADQRPKFHSVRPVETGCDNQTGRKVGGQRVPAC